MSHTAAATEKGAKKRNQDRSVIHRLTTQAEEESGDSEVVLGVFDGHGDNGEEVAEFLNVRLAHHASTEDLRAQLRSDPVAALKSLFDRLAADLAQEAPTIDCYISGSTACLAHIWNSKLTVGNLGDTRAVLASYPEAGKKDKDKDKDQDGPVKERSAKANVITRDHTCQEEEEKERILAAGGRVESLFENGQPIGQTPFLPFKGLYLIPPILLFLFSFFFFFFFFLGPLRVFKGTLPYPGLVVTRSFGDTVAHKVGVTAEPEITPIDLIEEDLFIIIATDGIWDILSPRQAVKFIQK